jgi:two-component system chemotaxis response regulator CheY
VSATKQGKMMPFKKFLIVDDDERFALLAARKLEHFGKCYTAESGEEALLYFQHHAQEGAPFDAVFMDIEMPRMNGHEVVGKMRAIEKQLGTGPAKEFKLIMVTAHSDVKNVSMSFFRGLADAYITKNNFLNTVENELKSINLTA